MLLLMCSIIITISGYVLFCLTHKVGEPDSVLAAFGGITLLIGLMAFIIIVTGMISIAASNDSNYDTKLLERAYLQYMIDNIEEDTPLELKASIHKNVIDFNESLEKIQRRHNSIWFNYLTPNYSGIDLIDLKESENNFNKEE